MLEIPESKVISLQAAEILTGRKIVNVRSAASPHKLVAFSADPSTYHEMLIGRKIVSTRGHGMFVDICLDKNYIITIGDGVNMRYYPSPEVCPSNCQLLIELDNGGCIVFTVAMYGGIWVNNKTFDNKYYQGSLNSISPLDEKFDEAFFEKILNSVEKDMSVKALLATEQRIPGLGNGTLQDILFNAGIHPKRKKSTLQKGDVKKLFKSLKKTLSTMTAKGGRDTEKDLYGNSGGYKTILSKNTLPDPCPACGGKIVKEAYMGGAIYFCPSCQKL